MSTKLKVHEAKYQELSKFDSALFEEFNEQVFRDSILVADQFVTWEKELSELVIQLDKDPTINLMGFFSKLEESQQKKSIAVDIVNNALSQKAIWDANLMTAERYLRKVKSELALLPDVQKQKNKELQEMIMFNLRPDVFDCQSFCETTVNWIKTMLISFDKRLDLLDSANLNINRQINVTELLSWKGLL